MSRNYAVVCLAVGIWTQSSAVHANDFTFRIKCDYSLSASNVTTVIPFSLSSILRIAVPLGPETGKLM